MPPTRSVKSTKSERSVRFAETEAEVHEDFMPYSCVYGKHPSQFVFDAQGNMTPRPHSEITVGTELECIMLMGVPYRTRPHLISHFEDCREVAFGERVLVKQLIDGWVKDATGWLPLELDGDSLFQAVCDDDPGLHLASQGASDKKESGKVGMFDFDDSWPPDVDEACITNVW